MTDLILSPHDETTEVTGDTEQGIAFVDAYTALDFEVVDSGRIVVPREGQEALEIRAREAGLTLQINPLDLPC